MKTTICMCMHKSHNFGGPEEMLPSGRLHALYVTSTIPIRTARGVVQFCSRCIELRHMERVEYLEKGERDAAEGSI